MGSKYGMLFTFLKRCLSNVLVGMVKIYQLVISPLLPKACRFYPSCSHYMIESIEKKGVIKGVLKGLLRLCKCHPWHPGGYDPVDESEEGINSSFPTDKT